MKSLLVLAMLATGCANGAVLVRDAYIYDGQLVLEKCHVKAEDDRLVVGRCYEETRALPQRTLQLAPPGAPLTAPASAAAFTVAPPSATPPSTTKSPAERTGFSLVRDEVFACGDQHGVSGTVRVHLDIRGGRIEEATSTSGKPSFEACLSSRLAGISLPDTQANRALIVPFSLRQR